MPVKSHENAQLPVITYVYTLFPFVPNLLGEQGVSDSRPGISATAQLGALEDIIGRRLLLTGTLGLVYRGTTFLSPHRHFIHVLPLKFLREAFIRRRTRPRAGAPRGQAAAASARPQGP